MAVKQLYDGPCVGGPMDGQQGQSRYPKGFLLVSRARDLVWIYEYEDGTFRVRDDKGEAVHHTEGADNRWRAANEGDYDVRAVEEE